MDSKRQTQVAGLVQKELANDFAHVACLELVIEHMTGKLVNES